MGVFACVYLVFGGLKEKPKEKSGYRSVSMVATEYKKFRGNEGGGKRTECLLGVVMYVNVV